MKELSVLSLIFWKNMGVGWVWDIDKDPYPYDLLACRFDIDRENI
jgi:hypothetical protein